MIVEHLPKINIVLGVLVIIFFFFPWVSVEVGNIVIMKCSGYDLATGNISVNERALQQESGELGTGSQVQPSTQGDRSARPQLYLLITIVCALGIMGYSSKMLSEFTRVGTVAVMAFGVFGLLIMVFGLWRDFGMDISADVASVIKAPGQLALYFTITSFLVSVALSFIGLRAFAEPSEEIGSIDVQIDTPQLIDEIEQLAPDNAIGSSSSNGFGDFVEKPSEETTCPTCGLIVSIHHAKCSKCGTNLHSKN